MGKKGSQRNRGKNVKQPQQTAARRKKDQTQLKETQGIVMKPEEEQGLVRILLLPLTLTRGICSFMSWCWISLWRLPRIILPRKSDLKSDEEYQKLQSNLSEERAKKDIAIKDNEDLKKKHYSLQEEITKAKQTYDEELANLNSKLESMQFSITSLHEHNDRLTKELACAEENINTLQNENVKLKDEKKCKEDENKSLEANIVAAETGMEDLTKKNEKLTGQITTVEEANKSLKECFENLERKITELNSTNENLAHRNENFQLELESLTTQLINLTEECKTVKEERDDAVRRLSELVSVRLRDNNPNITDLSDENRPTKLAEQFSELYDNEWTNAYSVMDERNTPEIHIAMFLLDIVMDSYHFCKHEMEGMWGLVSEWFLNQNNGSDEKITKSLKDARKHNATKMVDQMEQRYSRHLKEICKEDVTKLLNETVIQKYIADCVKLCLLMATCDPPVVIYHPGWIPLHHRPHKKHSEDSLQNSEKENQRPDYTTSTDGKITEKQIKGFHQTRVEMDDGGFNQRQPVSETDDKADGSECSIKSVQSQSVNIGSHYDRDEINGNVENHGCKNDTSQEKDGMLKERKEDKDKAEDETVEFLVQQPSANDDSNNYGEENGYSAVQVTSDNKDNNNINSPNNRDNKNVTAQDEARVPKSHENYYDKTNNSHVQVSSITVEGNNDENDKVSTPEDKDKANVIAMEEGEISKAREELNDKTIIIEPDSPKQAPSTFVESSINEINTTSMPEDKGMDNATAEEEEEIFKTQEELNDKTNNSESDSPAQLPSTFVESNKGKDKKVSMLEDKDIDNAIALEEKEKVSKATEEPIDKTNNSESDSSVQSPSTLVETNNEGDKKIIMHENKDVDSSNAQAEKKNTKAKEELIDKTIYSEPDHSPVQAPTMFIESNNEENNTINMPKDNEIAQEEDEISEAKEELIDKTNYSESDSPVQALPPSFKSNNDEKNTIRMSEDKNIVNATAQEEKEISKAREDHNDNTNKSESDSPVRVSSMFVESNTDRDNKIAIHEDKEMDNTTVQAATAQDELGMLKANEDLKDKTNNNETGQLSVQAPSILVESNNDVDNNINMPKKRDIEQEQEAVKCKDKTNFSETAHLPAPLPPLLTISNGDRNSTNSNLEDSTAETNDTLPKENESAESENDCISNSKNNGIEAIKEGLTGYDETNKTSKQANIDENGLDERSITNQIFNKTMFREYTSRGPFIEYVVWPPLMLYKDGPLLSKGVAQGTKNKSNKAGNDEFIWWK